MKYPAKTELFVKTVFSKSDLNHSYTSEKVFEYVLLQLFKSDLLDVIDISSCRATAPKVEIFHNIVQSSSTVDFSSLKIPSNRYATQDSLSQDRLIKLTACAIH